MKLCMAIGPWDGEAPLPMAAIKQAEALGYDTVWSAENYGADAMTPLAYIAGHTSRIKLGTSIAQLDARTPANLAMCSQTIDALAGGGRMVLGIGASGPQIVEGWYGRPWGRPTRRLRDTVAIVRKIFRREGPVVHEGEEISLPYVGEGSIGLGKPLKSIMKARDIPIMIGADTPLNVRLTGEIADGWLGFHLVPAMVPQALTLLKEGLAKRTDGKTLADFEVKAVVGVKQTDDVAAALQEPKPYIALYAGGMGAKSMNFHKDSMIKRGYGDAAERIQELFMAGRRQEAAAAVPDDYVDEEWLIGPLARIKERYKPWRDSGITSLTLRNHTPDVLELMAKIANA
jgi:F420-dependent oxidoreductase-like protein